MIDRSLREPTQIEMEFSYTVENLVRTCLNLRTKQGLKKKLDNLRQFRKIFASNRNEGSIPCSNISATIPVFLLYFLLSETSKVIICSLCQEMKF